MDNIEQLARDLLSRLSHDYGDSEDCPEEVQVLFDRGEQLLPIDATFQSLHDVLSERERQDAKWGEQNHDPFTYIAILVEEVGELAQAALHDRFGGPRAIGLREEAVHTAAVALAIVQCLDRSKWTWPK